MISSLRQTVSLSDRAADDVSDNLRPREAAAYVGLSESTLAKLRMRETRPMGPVFIASAGASFIAGRTLMLGLTQIASKKKTSRCVEHE